MWRKYHQELGVWLYKQERTHEAMKRIDHAILRDDRFPLVFNESLSTLADIMGYDYGTIDVGTIIHFEIKDGAPQRLLKKKDQYTASTQYTEPDSTDSIIRGISFGSLKEQTTDLEPKTIFSNDQECVSPLLKQWNVCLNKVIQNELADIFRIAISAMSAAFNPDSALDLLANNILSIFPKHFITELPVPHEVIRVQILMKEQRKRGGERLRIVESTDRNDIGGIVAFDRSVCGTLMRPLGTEKTLHESYITLETKKHPVFIFLGDPEELPKEEYAQTSIQTMRSELAVPLYSSSGDCIGALNLESEKQHVFTKAHARILVNLCQQIGTMIHDLHTMSLTWQENTKGVYRFIGNSVKRTVQNFQHNNGNECIRPISSFRSRVKEGHITDDNLTTDMVLELLGDVWKNITSNTEALSKSLITLGKEDELLDFKSTHIDAIRRFETDLSQVTLNEDIPENMPRLRLSPVFHFHYCELIMNALRSIERKQKQSSRTKTHFKPEITIMARPVEYVRRNGSTTRTIDEIDAKKFEISIEDNGAGVSSDQRKNLGRLGVSYSGEGSGHGLYSFIQYLAVMNGKHFIESEENKGFGLKFVVDTENS